VDQQTIRIYDIRGELILTLTGTSNFRVSDPLSLTVSPFVPAISVPGGSLNILMNGQVIATWDAEDQNGKLVTDGVYQIVVTEQFPDGSSIVLAQNASVAPYSNQGVIDFTAMPNMVHPGDVVKFSASFSGIVADGQSKIKIYDLAGELVNSLPLLNGTAAWDISNSGRQAAASGIYLAVLDGVNPVSGQHLTKTLKILVTR